MFKRIQNDRERQRQKAFYKKTQQNAVRGRRDLDQPVNKRKKTKASSVWWYRSAAIALTAALGISIPVLTQMLFMSGSNLFKPAAEKTGFFHDYGLGPVFLVWAFCVVPPGFAYILHRCRAVWANNNAMYLEDDIEEYANDAYVRTLDHIISEFDAAPDAGLGFDGHVSSIVGHMMVSNKGIKKIEMPLLDPEREGQVAVDENGRVKKKKMEMFDKDLGRELYKFSNVPGAHQKWYDATQYAFNEKNSKKEAKHGNARKGAFNRKAYDTLADYINGEFYPLDTDTQRPAGVYFYDSRPVNTILIAITRGGKGNMARLVG